MGWESVFFVFWRFMPVHDHFYGKSISHLWADVFSVFFIFSTVGTKTRFLPTNTKFLVEQKHKPKWKPSLTFVKHHLKKAFENDVKVFDFI